MKVNPILKREIKSDTRSIRLFLSIMGYNLVLFMVFSIGLNIIENNIGDYDYFYYGWYGDSVLDSYSSFSMLFPVIAFIQCGILGLIIPVITASSISGEKERQTFDIMLTTAITPMGIVRGKVFTAVTKMMLYVITSIPLMSMAFVFGGIRWTKLFGFIFIMLVYGFFVGSIGVLCSSICKSSKGSVILSFVYCGFIYFVTFVPMLLMLISYSRGRIDSLMDTPLLLLINPMVMMEEYLLGDIAALASISDSGEADELGIIMELLLRHQSVWIIVSMAAIVMLSMGFMKMAAKRINPMTPEKRRLRSKNKAARQSAN